MRCDVTSWTVVSSVFYVLGGALFIAGSVYVVPDLNVLCIEGDITDCSLDVAVWYFIGCFFYLAAAIIDLGFQLVELHRRGGWRSIRQIRPGRFDQFTESLFTGWIYLFGGILFFVGSVLFFPAFNARIPARLTFRAGSCCYISGSSYGIFQLLFPSEDDETKDEDVRPRTMTQIERLSLVPETILVRVEEDIEAGGIFLPDPEPVIAASMTKKPLSSFIFSSKKMRGMRRERVQRRCCKRCTPAILLSIFVKASFICGSSSFLIGGVLFGESLFLIGGWLWLEGSVLFLLGALVSLATVLYGMRTKSAALDSDSRSSSTPSSVSANLTPIAPPVPTTTTSSAPTSTIPFSATDAAVWVQIRDEAMNEQHEASV